MELLAAILRRQLWNCCHRELLEPTASPAKEILWQQSEAENFIKTII
ncbi:Hypothetical predicted protein [Podarcis lilfordi]|uniref:Uncharacterized protein n=1 Tax=Podarcis lilfordi TaxID=74358 RepID=A0AA35KCH7_9SAUR|nr:Hypothetical predicted protein [Podarcis lilfordi]